MPQTYRTTRAQSASRTADGHGSAKKPKGRKKTPEFLRSRNENSFGMLIAAIAISILVAAVGVNSYFLKEKERKYAAEESALELSIEQENARTEELKELEKYTKTKKYVEEVAKDKLGLVYDNEIIFKETD